MFKNKWFIVVSFLIGIGVVLLIWFGEPSTVYNLTREDGEVENMTAIFYVFGVIFSSIAIFKGKRELLPVFWALACFAFLGEETSWFQRLLNYSVPVVEEANAQGEFNLHNLNVFQGGGFVNNSSIGLDTFLKSQNLFRMGFFGYFLVLPILYYIPKVKRLLTKVGYVKPSVLFQISIFIVFTISFTLAIYSERPIKRALAESREMLYAFFIMVYVIFYIWIHKRAVAQEAV